MAFLKQSIETTDAAPARKELMKRITHEGIKQYTNDGQHLDEELEFASANGSAYNYLQWCHNVDRRGHERAEDFDLLRKGQK